MNYNYGCWYVQTTGIWKSVWLEYVDDVYLESLKITPNLKDYTVRFDFGVSAPGDDVAVRFDIGFRGVKLHSVAAAANNRHNSVTVSLPSEKLTYQVELWTPCNPALYDLDIAVSKGGQETDRVGSYFAIDCAAADLVTQLRYNINGYHIVKGFTGKNIIQNKAVVNN